MLLNRLLERNKRQLSSTLRCCISFICICALCMCPTSAGSLHVALMQSAEHMEKVSTLHTHLQLSTAIIKHQDAMPPHMKHRRRRRCLLSALTLTVTLEAILSSCACVCHASPGVTHIASHEDIDFLCQDEAPCQTPHASIAIVILIQGVNVRLGNLHMRVNFLEMGIRLLVKDQHLVR